MIGLELLAEISALVVLFRDATYPEKVSIINKLRKNRKEREIPPWLKIESAPPRAYNEQEDYISHPSDHLPLPSITFSKLYKRRQAKNKSKILIPERVKISHRSRKQTDTFWVRHDSGRKICKRCGKMSTSYHRQATNCKP